MSSETTEADRRAWIDRLAAGAVAKMEALPKWKRDYLRAQIATLGRSESNAG
jgi:hypothetical protein